MPEPRAIKPPIKPDTSAQELMARCVAIVMASIALGGLIVWAGLGGGETYQDSVASIARDSDVRRLLFSEKNRELYVTLPPNAIEPRSAATPARTGPADGNTALASLATLPRPRKKPLRASAATQQTPDEATPPLPAQQEAKQEKPSAAAEASGAPYETKPEPARHASTLDEQVSAKAARDELATEEPALAESTDQPSAAEPTAGAAMQDEPSWDDEQPLDEPTWGEPTWDERALAEPLFDEPPADGLFEPEGRS